MASVTETKKTKKGTKVLVGIAIAVLSIIVCWVVANAVTCGLNKSFAASFPSVESDIAEPVATEDGYAFTTDRDLKVLRLTDIHIGGGWISYTRDKQELQAVADLITAAKPDLVVLTGDSTYAVIETGTFNNGRPAKTLGTLLESLGVWWTLVPGNHDCEPYDFYDYDKWAPIYQSFDHCLLTVGPEDVYGCGNHVIDVQNSAGEITQSLILLDSNSYPGNKVQRAINEPQGNYDNIHDDQLQWYRDMVAKRSTGDSVAHSLLFFHIPTEEFDIAWQEYKANGYKDTEDVQYIFGKCDEKGEQVCDPGKPDQVFETVKEVGSSSAIFCGHDHLNNFAVNYKGIRLDYGLSIDCVAYYRIQHRIDQRGGEVITLKANSSDYTVEQLHYADVLASK